jgi:tRNA threonylcarbamoyladenosine biosynthesis protein TsaE
MKTFFLSTLKKTQQIAYQLAQLSMPKDVITLQGDLGAGKTEFARAFIRELTHHEMIVPSPTFTLVEIYETKIGTVWHLDLYRLKSDAEIWDLGIEEAFAQAITLIEWPERLGKAFSFKNYLEVSLRLQKDGQSRELSLMPYGNWVSRLEKLGLDA